MIDTTEINVWLPKHLTASTWRRVKNTVRCVYCDAAIGDPCLPSVMGRIHIVRWSNYRWALELRKAPTPRNGGRPRSEEPRKVRVTVLLTEAEAATLDRERGNYTRAEALRTTARKAGWL